MNTAIIVVLATWAFIVLPAVLLTFRYVEDSLNRYKLGTRTNSNKRK